MSGCSTFRCQANERPDSCCGTSGEQSMLFLATSVLRKRALFATPNAYSGSVRKEGDIQWLKEPWLKKTSRHGEVTSSMRKRALQLRRGGLTYGLTGCCRNWFSQRDCVSLLQDQGGDLCNHTLGGLDTGYGSCQRYLRRTGRQTFHEGDQTDHQFRRLLGKPSRASSTRRSWSWCAGEEHGCRGSDAV